MNDQSKGELIEQKIDRAAAGAVAVGSEFGGLRIQNMLEVMEMSKLMAVSQQAVPPHLRNNPGMCLAVCLSALEWRMSPFAVANKTYLVNDRLSHESQLVHAVIEARAPLKERLKVRYEGEGDERVCIVSGTFRGETEAREHRSLPLAKARVNGKSPLWSKKPDVQLFYDTSRDFCRIYCPDVLLGIYTPDEVEQYGIGDDAKDVTAGAALHDRLKAAGQSGEGFHPDAVDNGLNGHDVAETQHGDKPAGEAAGAVPGGEATTHGGGAESEPTKPARKKPGPKPKGAPTDAPPPEPETKPTPPAIPTTAAEYRAHVESYVGAATEVVALTEQWKSEKAMRNNIPVGGADFDDCYGIYLEKLNKLRDDASTPKH